MYLLGCLKIICFFITGFYVHFIWASGVNDPRYASLTCNSIKDKLEISCDYRFSSSLDVINIGAKIGQQPIQISKELITPYPAPDQTTALLFLIDSSDPTRKFTVEKRIVGDIFQILSSFGPQRKNSLKIGIAVFDTNLKMLSQIGEDEATSLNSLSRIKADGQATEFYKSIIEAIAVLSKTDASRKGLIIFSDGKDEDRAYKIEDALKAAKDANIVVLGLGYTEKPADTPYLQTLKKLSDETHGNFFNATNRNSIEGLLKDPLAFIEKGGRVILDTKGFYGNQTITLDLGIKDSKSIAIQTNIEIPDTRKILEKFKDFLVKYWLSILLILSGLFLISYFVYKYIQKRKLSKPLYIEYGYLVEPDGSGSKYIINKTAIRIGRSKDNDICLINGSISLHHAEIHRRRDGTFYIVDLGSTNGVYVNTKKIIQNELKNGDDIELGEVRLNFYSTY